MKFALHKESMTRIKPSPGLVAICQWCESEIIARCGHIRIHHWAHKKNHECDHWWETETDWHREWKNQFPEDWQEKIRSDEATGEKHIADIYNPDRDLVVEFQNSPITLEELKSREAFYSNMVWVVNAKKFRIELSSLDQFLINIIATEEKMRIEMVNNRQLSYDEVEKLSDYRVKLHRVERDIREGKITQEDSIEKRTTIMSELAQNSAGIDLLIRNQATVELHKCHEDGIKYREENIINATECYVHYSWSRKRKIWEDANAPVFLDFGDQLLLLKSKFIAKQVSREEFIIEYGSARDNCAEIQ